MSILAKLDTNQINRLLEFCVLREREGISETEVRNWQMASLLLEVQLSRALLHKYGVTDKVDLAFEKAPNPLDYPIDEGSM